MPFGYSNSLTSVLLDPVPLYSRLICTSSLLLSQCTQTACHLSETNPKNIVKIQLEMRLYLVTYLPYPVGSVKSAHCTMIELTRHDSMKRA